MHRTVWFWQRIVSPHIAGLAAAMAELGWDVTYVAERFMSADRAKQGWEVPDLGKAHLVTAQSIEEASNLARDVSPCAIHLCQGLRNNGIVGEAQRILAARNVQQWVMMETVDDKSWRGFLRRLEYRRLFSVWRNRLQGVLATGYRTPEWVVDRGMDPNRVYPFAYFLPDPSRMSRSFDESSAFTVLYVGRYIPLKRIDLLFNALNRVSELPFQVKMVGAGPLEGSLREQANTQLPGRVQWLGTRSIDEIPELMAQADCLVLPSRHDGWGAVGSESLMAGTPVICSDACGVAGVVSASSVGGVFRSGNTEELARLLGRQIVNGAWPPYKRMTLANWAKCLGAEAGAEYLTRILEPHASAARPSPPWEVDTGKLS